MEKNTPSRESFQRDYLVSSMSQYEVPKYIVGAVMKNGLFFVIRRAINRLRFRVTCRVLYNLDLLRTCQIHYNQLKASKVLRWLILKSMTSYRLSTLISKIENHYKPENSVKIVNLRSSKIFDDMIKENADKISREEKFITSKFIYNAK